jgi:hypothetical protein
VSKTMRIRDGTACVRCTNAFVMDYVGAPLMLAQENVALHDIMHLSQTSLSNTSTTP